MADAAALAATEGLDISDRLDSDDRIDTPERVRLSSMLEQLQASGDSVVADAAAGSSTGEDVLNKTTASQLTTGANSYYYWHSDAERRRQAGEQPLTVPLPKKLASSIETEVKKPIRGIEKCTFLGAYTGFQPAPLTSHAPCVTCLPLQAANGRAFESHARRRSGCHQGVHRPRRPADRH